ncbi:hypothetical protein J0904_02225 [Acinetobacter bereziniae]|uniref:hypothetical protein n=1 Tax=Acinetobacter bereziniae TaxID=106648 RepID=UPI0020759562|nr:hypothetical protein [Acinetobacter bereziniae]MCM8510905.1 hypothetical protein [Acinetobacter bereziniae]
MVSKVRFSDSYSSIEDIKKFYYYSNESFKPYFNTHNTNFIGYSIPELNSELSEQKLALDRMSALEILALLEARFRIDYLIRCQNKKKDYLSKNLRQVYKVKGNRASLTDDILKEWKLVYSNHKILFDSFKNALDYRNWLAHGRYWEPKKFSHVKKYDYLSVIFLANELLSNLPLHEPDYF